MEPITKTKFVKSATVKARSFSQVFFFFLVALIGLNHSLVDIDHCDQHDLNFGKLITEIIQKLKNLNSF